MGLKVERTMLGFLVWGLEEERTCSVLLKGLSLLIHSYLSICVYT